MKVELDLPDWADDGQAIRIFAGIELVAKKFMGKPWEVKTVRCNMCGECCTISSPGWKETTVGVKKNGRCVALIPKPDEPGKFLCRLGSGRPFSCSAYAAGPDDEDLCCIRWKIIEK